MRVDDEAWRRGVTIYAPGRPRRRCTRRRCRRARRACCPTGTGRRCVLTVVVDRAGQATLRSASSGRWSAAGPSWPTSPRPIGDCRPLLPELGPPHRGRGRGARRLAPRRARTGDRHRSGRAERRRGSACGRGIADEDANAAASARGQPGRGGHDGRRPQRTVPHDGRSRTIATSAALRRTAAAMGVAWPEGAQPAGLRPVARSAGPEPGRVPVRGPSGRRGSRATRPGTAEHRPWHAAMAASYAHATAPMRRLADRYVLDVVLALTAGEEPGADARRTASSDSRT